MFEVPVLSVAYLSPKIYSLQIKNFYTRLFFNFYTIRIYQEFTKTKYIFSSNIIFLLVIIYRSMYYKPMSGSPFKSSEVSHD